MMSEVLHRSRLIGGRVHLLGVRLVSAQAQLLHEPPAGSLRAGTSVTTGAAAQDLTVEAYVRYRVATYREDSTNDEDPIFFVEATWALEYRLDEGTAPPTQLDAEAFASVSGVMAVHPYAREHVASVTTQMGCSALVLDVVRVPTEITEAADFDVPLEAEKTAQAVE